MVIETLEQAIKIGSVAIGLGETGGGFFSLVVFIVTIDLYMNQ